MKLTHRKLGNGSLRTLMKSFVAFAATSALMVTGLTFVMSSPASAAGTPDHVTFTTVPSGTAVTGTNLASFAVSVQDSSGATITSGTGSTDSIVLTSACALAGTLTVSANAGVATFNDVAFESTGSPCTLTATDHTTSSVTTASASITVSPGALPHLTFTAPLPSTSATINTAIPTFHVSLEDTSNNVVTSGPLASDMIGIGTPAGCTINTVTPVSLAGSGVASFSGVTFTAGSTCQLVATDTSTGGVTNATVSVAVATNTPSKLGFTTEPSATVTAGAILPSFAVSIEESNGIVITSGTGSIDVVTLSSTCALSGTTTATAVAGVATFTLATIKTGVTCSLVATDATRTLTTATSNAVTVLPGAAAKVAFTTAPPTTVTTAGTLIASFKVSVEDTNGNVLTSGIGTNDTITISAASPCTLGGTTTGVAVAGVATFSLLSISDTGTCVLTATDSTRALVTAAATTIVGAPQAALSITSLRGFVGTALRIKTSGGTGTGAVTLTVTAGTAGCSVSGSTVKATRAGTCLVTATKAATTTYIAISSAATTVSFILPFKVTRVAGTIFAGRTQAVTLVGSGFYGRPRIIANVPGFSAKVARDTGRTLRVIVTVSPRARRGVHTMTVILSNGKRTSVRFSLH